MVEELFGVALTEAEWDSLSEILRRAWNEDSRFVRELQQRLDDVQSGPQPIALDSRRDMIAALGGLCRLGEAREYAQWLTGMVMRRNL